MYFTRDARRETLKIPLLHLLLVALHLIADLELRPLVKAHAALVPLARFRHVLFDVFERGEGTWLTVSKPFYVDWGTKSSDIPS